MKETGIIMSGDHPKLILGGTKTMTRRVIIDPRKRQRSYIPNQGYGHSLPSVGDLQRELELTKDTPPNFPCPYGQVGDRLWVRETWCQDTDFGHGITKHMVYKASAHPNAGFVWKPSIHMFRWMSRITLEITEIKVERVQEISLQDILAEGVSQDMYNTSPTKTFELLWDSINAKRGHGWDANPWVWVISFKVSER